MKRFRSKAILGVVALLVAAACLWFWHDPLARRLARLLIVDQPRADSDYLWIRTEDGFSYDGDRCYDVAARLYHQAPSRRILLIEPYPVRLVQIEALPSFEAVTRRQLAARGVPDEAVTVVPGKARSGWEEARLLAAWLKDQPGRQVLLLCDRFESGNRRYVLDAVLPPDLAARVRILALHHRHYDETNWWKSRCGLKGFMFASLALAYAWCHGEDQRAPQPWNPDEYQRLVQQRLGEASP